MTKKELIDAMRDYPDDAEICYWAVDYVVTPVYDLTYYKKYNRIELF